MTEKKVHLIGIGGIGMSALAIILAEKGVQVSGSDMGESYVTDHLKEVGIRFLKGHEQHHVEECSEVIYSTAVKENNPELVAAKNQGNALKHRSILLKELMTGFQPLLVAGTHGKTTTSGLLAHTMVKVGAQPSFAIGGFIKSLNTNGGYGKGRYFVAESDESDGSFLNYQPYGAIVTNIDTDHLDYWKTYDNLLKGFKDFIASVQNKDLLFWCYEDRDLKSMKLPGYSYGFASEADVRITSYKQQGAQLIFDIEFQGKKYSDIAVFGMGKHSVLNAVAVFALCLQLGISAEAIKEAFSSFQGMKRRVDLVGQHKGALIFDDYGHHPTELEATIKGVKNAFGDKKLLVAFEPHRYSRTQLCWNEFLDAFNDADEVIITDIYGAGETPIAHLTGEALAREVARQASSLLKVSYVPREKLAAHYLEILDEDKLLLTLGAGGITKLGKEILQLAQVGAAAV